MKYQTIIDKLAHKKIIILGFGREGVSTFRFLRKHLPNQWITIADKSEALNIEEFKEDKKIKLQIGEGYDQNLNDFDFILKTPGVNLNSLNYFIYPEKITSQTDLFLQAFHNQVIGVTGTKGKSTTASLIYHLLKGDSSKKTLLAGNIGIPLFDIMDMIEPNTAVVAELSAHQLEYVQQSPHIAIMLNIFQEHLDHFNSFSNYQISKVNITKYQSENDILIYNNDDIYLPALIKSNGYQRVTKLFSYLHSVPTGASCGEDKILITDDGEIKSEFPYSLFKQIPGTHNYNNIMAAILACKCLNVSDNIIIEQLKTFKGLPHRIELVGKFNEITFYNDSISTIPEATIAAIKTLKKVDTLIIGGFDRGIDYSLLINYLHEFPIQNIVFMGPAGKRIYEEWSSQYQVLSNILLENNMEKIITFAFKNTQKKRICLMSPGASSYDQYKNFEERGTVYKAEIERQSTQYQA